MKFDKLSHLRKNNNNNNNKNTNNNDNAKGLEIVLRFKRGMQMWRQIGHFRIVFCLFFEASRPRAKPFI